MLLDCMADSYAKDTWNTTIYKGLCTLMVRVDEIRPLLQPAQVVPGTQTQRPPAPEPKIRESEVAEVADVAEEISEQFQSDEGREVLDEALQNVMQSTVGQIRELNTSGEDTERKLHKMRRILKGLAYVTGGLVGAVGTGVVVNLLTAPAAAGTLLTRLQPLYEAILKFFV